MIIVNLFEGDERAKDLRLLIYKKHIVVEICVEHDEVNHSRMGGYGSESETWYEWDEYADIPILPKCVPAIIEALKKVSEGGE